LKFNDEVFVAHSPVLSMTPIFCLATFVPTIKKQSTASPTHFFPNSLINCLPKPLLHPNAMALPTYGSVWVDDVMMVLPTLLFPFFDDNWVI
jgi:hypothetical protein